MTFDDVRRIVLDPETGGPGIDDLRDHLHRGEVLDEPSIDGRPGHATAASTRATFAVRRKSTSDAGFEVLGLDELLEALVPSDDEVLLFHFGSARRHFTVFVRERDGALIGGISLSRRWAPDSPPEPSLRVLPMKEIVLAVHDLQERLLQALHVVSVAVSTQQALHWPSPVGLIVDDVPWTGHRHGLGYRFGAPDGRVVEAHSFIVNPPFPVDAYRVSTYAESIDIDAMSMGNRLINVEHHVDCEAGLLALVDEGVLVRDERVPRVKGIAFLPASPRRHGAGSRAS